MSKKYYNNGIEAKMFEEDTQPEGWVLGRKLEPTQKEIIETIEDKVEVIETKVPQVEIPKIETEDKEDTQSPSSGKMFVSRLHI